ncbi:MAG: hypothetical protein EBY39_07475 [Flavobacteriia bacterium]|nr:hypothetical protein [Flavobacteriia bacterium]
MFTDNGETEDDALDTLTEGNPSQLDEWAAEQAAQAIEASSSTAEEACPTCEPPYKAGDLIIDVEELKKRSPFNIDPFPGQVGIRASIERGGGGCEGAIAQSLEDNPDATEIPQPETCLS